MAGQPHILAEHQYAITGSHAMAIAHYNNEAAKQAVFQVDTFNLAFADIRGLLEKQSQQIEECRKMCSNMQKICHSAIYSLNLTPQALGRAETTRESD
ncbi:hypothetical protein CVT26_013126 [Gymnopilus dilepis]|uniref:Uncharacterized protein n=1 Tax=Gymnopilus dilepis TaxID=231916 RepID=A0A409YF84_9AGAR|nr:hypothetical protein CVT26_013126 [Gymnopilus dilepis]